MLHWLNFVAFGLIMTLVMVGGFLLRRRKNPVISSTNNQDDDARILYLLLWLASLSILAYIAFVFGKR